MPLICGVASPLGILCRYTPLHAEPHSWEHLLGHVEQAAPVPNDGPSMHHLVIADIMSRDLRWDLGVGSARHIRDKVADDLQARRQLGLDRYGSLLQAHNGRNALRDLYEELQDAAVYARQRLAETDESAVEYLVLYEVYDSVVSALPVVRRLLDAATE